ncbi:hypothetical protein [Curtobacterium caseinilyticum]|uniref:DUF4878 domain-containing protein n=1 Tax=Curtobacterium caseinilyticum TaxID=3055137 RepID=A0ABT7TQ50_9MICO|nr:hypothetical protein [Curtobacterium caseinilyticum]MDM7891725.1 hypothetical protein [Curtobacterium caseinilyticum]
MTDQQPDGWAAVPHVDTLRGTQEAPVPAGVPTPARRRRPVRRGALVGIVAGGVAVVVLAVTGVVGYVSQSASHAADRPVRAFLDDLTAGRVDDALDAAGIDHDDQDVLLTDAAYAKASGRVTGYRIAATRTDGDTATVRAYLRQGGRDVAATFTLDREGTDWGVFPVWALEAPELGEVELSVRGPAGTPVEVAGQRIATSEDGTARLSALPGTYAVAVDGGKWFTAEGASAQVSGFGVTGSAPVAMTTTLTSAGEQAAQQAVDRWVDGCIASTDAAPAGCSFYAYGEDPEYAYSNQKWTLEQRPRVTVGGWLSRGWAVSTTTFGRATFTADISGPGGVGTASAGPMNVNASGYVSGFTDEGATFESAIGNGASDTGS